MKTALTLDVVQLTIIFLTIAIIGYAQAQAKVDKEELYRQDPHASGVRQCRKCTLEYLKLTRLEQAIWTQYKDGTPDEIRNGFKNLNIVYTFGMGYENNAPPYSAGGLKDRNGLFDQYKLSEGERNLINSYMDETDKTVTKDEVRASLQSLYQTINFIKAWQEYEFEVLKKDKKPKTIEDKVAKYYEDVLIPNLTNHLKNHQQTHVEL